MNKSENEIINYFLNDKSEKKFINNIQKLLNKKIGFKLFTLTVMHPNNKFVTRIYSSNKNVYPEGGQKKVPNNYWAKITIKEKKSFIGNNKKQIQKYFYDHNIITNLDCESILNQVIVFDKKTIGTMNLLNVKNFFNNNHLKLTDFVSKFLLPTFLKHQLIISKYDK